MNKNVFLIFQVFFFLLGANAYADSILDDKELICLGNDNRGRTFEIRVDYDDNAETALLQFDADVDEGAPYLLLDQVEIKVGAKNRVHYFLQDEVDRVGGHSYVLTFNLKKLEKFLRSKGKFTLQPHQSMIGRTPPPVFNQSVVCALLD